MRGNASIGTGGDTSSECVVQFYKCAAIHDIFRTRCAIKWRYFCIQAWVLCTMLFRMHGCSDLHNRPKGLNTLEVIEKESTLIENVVYVKIFRLANTPECRVLEIRDRTKKEIARTNIKSNAYKLKENPVLFIEANELFAGSNTEESTHLKRLCAALYAHMLALIPTDTHSDLKQYMPEWLARRGELCAQLSANLDEEIQWFEANVCAGSSGGSYRWGISMIVALLLVTDKFSELSPASQAAAMDRLRIIDISRFIAIALLCNIDGGLLKWLPPIIRQKNSAGYQIILGARCFAMNMIVCSENSIYAKVRAFLCGCLKKMLQNATIDREMWWYVCVLARTFEINPFRPRTKCALDLGLGGTAIQMHTAVRNNWPPVLWEEQAYKEARCFTSEMILAFMSHPPHAMPQLVRYPFFECCVPDASFITLARHLIDWLYLGNKDKTVADENAVRFAQYAISCLEALFSTWLRNKLLPFSAADTLFAMLLDSRAHAMVPALVDIFRSQYQTLPLVDAKDVVLFPSASRAAQIAASAAKSILLHPISEAAAKWIAGADSIVATIGDWSLDYAEMFQMSMLTIEPVPRIALLWHALRHRYAGAQAVRSPDACDPRSPDIFWHYPLDSFIVYLLYDKTVLWVLDNAPVSAAAAQPTCRAQMAARLPPAEARGYFTEEYIDDICDGIASMWCVQLAVLADHQPGPPNKYIVMHAYSQKVLQKRRGMAATLRFLSGVLASRRLRDMLRARLNNSFCVIKAIHAIWTQLINIWQIDIKALTSVPLLCPLMCEDSRGKEAIPVQMVTAIAMLRLSRFLLERAERCPPTPGSAPGLKFATVAEQDIYAMLTMAQGCKFGIVADECITQLAAWMRIPIIRDALLALPWSTRCRLLRLVHALFNKISSQHSEAYRTALTSIHTFFIQ